MALPSSTLLTVLLVSTVALDVAAAPTDEVGSGDSAAPSAVPRSSRPLPKSGAPPGSPMSVEATAVAFAGVVPAPTGGASLGLAYRARGAHWLRLRAIGTLDTPVSVAGRHPTVSLQAAQLDVCEELRLTRLDLFACGGLAGGRWKARELGPPDHGRDLTWAAVGASLEVQLALTDDLWFLARVDGYVPLVRPSLDIVDARGAASTTRASPVAAALGLGARLIF